MLAKSPVTFLGDKIVMAVAEKNIARRVQRKAEAVGTEAPLGAMFKLQLPSTNASTVISKKEIGAKRRL